MIEAKGLIKSFGSVEAVKDFSLEVKQGEVFGLIGPDGAGKSTLMRLLSGLLLPSQGRALVAGEDVSENPEAVKERIGYMPQQFSLYGDLTIQENLNFFASMFFVPKKKRKEQFSRLYQFSRLEPFKDRRAEKLSGGMQKKLALSCILIHNPDLLMLDEPTTGVDPVSRRELWDMLYQLVEDGLTILVCTPYMDEAERCHRVGLMHEGRMLRVDTPQNIRSSLDAPLIAVTGKDTHHIVRILRENPQVLGAYPTGQKVHAVLKATHEEAPAIASAWETQYPEITSANVGHPTFEDAFIHMVENG